MFEELKSKIGNIPYDVKNEFFYYPMYESFFYEIRKPTNDEKGKLLIRINSAYDNGESNLPCTEYKLLSVDEIAELIKADWKETFLKNHFFNDPSLIRSPEIIPPTLTPSLTAGKSTQDEIVEITEAMKDLLLYKNKKYGDSAINPKKIFYKGDSTNSILIRLDDKLGRIIANKEEKPRINDVADIIGYCTLLLISMGVSEEDIAKFKD